MFIEDPGATPAFHPVGVDLVGTLRWHRDDGIIRLHEWDPVRGSHWQVRVPTTTRDVLIYVVENIPAGLEPQDGIAVTFTAVLRKDDGVAPYVAENLCSADLRTCAETLAQRLHENHAAIDDLYPGDPAAEERLERERDNLLAAAQLLIVAGRSPKAAVEADVVLPLQEWVLVHAAAETGLVIVPSPPVRADA